MPNWCLNKLTIEHEDRAKVMEFVHAYKEGKACEHYLPVPKRDDGELSYERLVELGVAYRVNNWGTKWDIGSDNNEAHGLNPTVVDNQASMTFDSAWSPPIGLYEKLDELGFLVSATYFEPAMGFCGKWYDGNDEYYEGSNLEDFPQDLIEEYDMEEFYEEEEV